MRTKCERGDSVYAGFIEVSPAFGHFQSLRNLVQCVDQVRPCSGRKLALMTMTMTVGPSASERARRNRRAFFFLQFPYSLIYWLTQI